MKYQGRIQDFFLGGGCTRLLLYFNTNKPQVISGGGGVRTPCTPPLDPPLNINIHLKRTIKFKLHNEYNKRTLFNILYSCFKRAIDNKIANLIR